MAYATTADVAAYCANLIDNAGDFSVSTKPTKTQVQRWLDQGANQIDTELKKRGYAPPDDDSLAIYGRLIDLNAFYATARAEKARTNVRLSPGERTRGQVFQKDFDDGLKELLSGDLSRAGLDYSHLGYVGGVSVADKEAVQSDADIPPHRFSKDQFKNPRAPTHKDNDQSNDIEVRQ